MQNFGYPSDTIGPKDPRPFSVTRGPEGHDPALKNYPRQLLPLHHICPLTQPSQQSSTPYSLRRPSQTGKDTPIQEQLPGQQTRQERNENKNIARLKRAYL